MVNNNLIESLIQCILEEKKLNESTFVKYGIHSEDLEVFEKLGYLMSQGNKAYALLETDLLVEYCFMKKNNNELNVFYSLMKRCVLLYPSTKNSFFYFSIGKKSYDVSFIAADMIINSDDIDSKKDVYFCLYLLSIFKVLPKKYSDLVKGLTLQDLLYDVSHEKSDLNKMIECAWNKDFKQAIVFLEENGFDKSRERKNFETYKVLLNRIHASVKNDEKNINSLLLEGKYEDVKELLLELKRNYGLTKEEKYILKLIDIYLEIRKNKKIPEEVKFKKTTDYYKAIDSNDFETALVNAPENSSIGILLRKICVLINEIKSRDRNLRIILDGGLAESDVLLEIGFKCFELYLAKIDKTEYEDFLNNLLTLAILEGDRSLTLVKNNLSKIQTNSFEIDIQSYVQKFYECLKCREFDKAYIYIKLINSGSKVNGIPIMTKGLKRALEQSKKEYQFIHEYESQQGSSQTDVSKEDYTNDIITDIHDEVARTKRAVIVDAIEVKNIAVYDDMYSFSIFYEKPMTVFQYYSEENREDLKTLNWLAMNAYSNKDYENCIKYYLAIFELGTANIADYGRVGISYGMLEKYEEALLYLKIGDGLSKIRKKKYNYKNLINNYEKMLKDMDKRKV